jgi:hypothetical protein
MRHLLAFTLIFAALNASGCAWLQAGGIVADTPAKRWAQEREALTSLNGVFGQLIAANKLSDKQIVEYGTTLSAASSLLDTAQTSLKANDGTFDSTLQQVSDMLTSLQAVLTEINHGSNSDSGDRRWGDFNHLGSAETGCNLEYQRRNFGRGPSGDSIARPSLRCAA